MTTFSFVLFFFEVIFLILILRFVFIDEDENDLDFIPFDLTKLFHQLNPNLILENLFYF
jgi:hypothetical protein